MQALRLLLIGWVVLHAPEGGELLLRSEVVIGAYAYSPQAMRLTCGPNANGVALTSTGRTFCVRETPREIMELAK